MAHLPVIYHDERDIELARNKYGEDLVKLQEILSLETPKDIDAAAEAVGSHQPFYLAAQGLNDRDLQKTYGEMVCRIMAATYPQWSEAPSMPSVASGEPIRVGIVSGHFFHHSVWKIPIRGWIDNLDKNKFSLHCYYTGTIKDHVTAYARQTCTRFVEDVKSAEKLCRTIREDNLHILIYAEIGMDPATLKLAALSLRLSSAQPSDIRTHQVFRPSIIISAATSWNHPMPITTTPSASSGCPMYHFLTFPLMSGRRM
jgi:hypothetical protein